VVRRVSLDGRYSSIARLNINKPALLRTISQTQRVTFDKIRQVDQGAIADNKRLGAVLAMIRDEQLRDGPERRSGPRRRDQSDPHLFKVG
jgi:hypothetical protein